MDKLNKYQNMNYQLDLYRFTKARKICITASKPSNNRFISEVIHKLAQNSMINSTDCYINELCLNSLNIDNEPFDIYFKQNFSVKKLVIKDSDISFILNQCFDIETLELIDSAIDLECIPFLFQHQNRNNIKNIIFHDYRRKEENEDNTDETDDISMNGEDDEFYLMNQNGLFLKEFEGILMDEQGDKFKSIQCEGNLDLTKYFLYNILKLSFNSLESLHIEELNLLNINGYDNIYEDMVLYGLKELCFTCSVDEDIKDDFVLNGDMKYFQTPNLERLNIEITSFISTDSMDNDDNENNMNNHFNIKRYLKIFGIKELKYLGINIDQNIDDQTVLLSCLNGLNEYILHQNMDISLAEVIKLNISAEWFTDIQFKSLVQGIQNLVQTVNTKMDNKRLDLLLSLMLIYCLTKMLLMYPLLLVVVYSLFQRSLTPCFPLRKQSGG